jgi:hypothetical protein
MIIGMPEQLSIFKGSKLPEEEDPFDVFWSYYPRKHGKKPAREKWIKLKLTDSDLAKIVEYIKNKQQTGWRDPQFIPMASTFLNQRRWEDDPPSLVRRGADGLVTGEPEIPHTEDELKSIAKAIVRESQKRLIVWNQSYDRHKHGKECQHGHVCAFVESKRPTVPTLEQARKAIRI